MTVGPDYASEHKFPPLRLGPVSRVSTDGGATHIPARVPDAWDEHKDFRYPRIVVRDPFGRTLDTFTALQDAIYRASWARKKNGEWPKTPIEWRLPKAPVPARPDYSRSGPLHMTANLLPARHAGTTQSYDASSRELHMTTNVLMDLPTL
ncbi:cyclin-dependent kinase 12, partial [Biomphalaria glabrata]